MLEVVFCQEAIQPAVLISQTRPTYQTRSIIRQARQTCPYVGRRIDLAVQILLGQILT